MEIGSLTKYKRHRNKTETKTERNSNNKEQLNAEIAEYDIVTTEFQRIYEAVFRSKIRLVDQGEKPTK